MNKLPEITFGVAWAGFAEKRCEEESSSPLSFLQDILSMLWTRGPGQMVMVTVCMASPWMTRFSIRKINLLSIARACTIKHN